MPVGDEDGKNSAVDAELVDEDADGQVEKIRRLAVSDLAQVGDPQERTSAAKSGRDSAR